jgi:hypothetical protein
LVKAKGNGFILVSEFLPGIIPALSKVRVVIIAIAVYMAGLGLFDQKSAIAVTMPIVTAFKFCIGHRKNGLLNC